MFGVRREALFPAQPLQDDPNLFFGRELPARDRRNRRWLRSLGWEVMTVWECQTGHPDLESRLRRFLEHT